MNSTKKQKPDYLNFGKYAMGGVGFSMTNMIVLTYLTFFCTDIFGISSLTVAGLMLVTKVIDAVTDPIMGFIADQTRSKSGRYRPYLIYGSPILGVLIYLLCFPRFCPITDMIRLRSEKCIFSHAGGTTDLQRWS